MESGIPRSKLTRLLSYVDTFKITCLCAVSVGFAYGRISDIHYVYLYPRIPIYNDLISIFNTECIIVYVKGAHFLKV